MRGSSQATSSGVPAMSARLSATGPSATGRPSSSRSIEAATKRVRRRRRAARRCRVASRDTSIAAIDDAAPGHGDLLRRCRRARTSQLVGRVGGHRPRRPRRRSRARPGPRAGRGARPPRRPHDQTPRRLAPRRPRRRGRARRRWAARADDLLGEAAIGAIPSPERGQVAERLAVEDDAARVDPRVRSGRRASAGASGSTPFSVRRTSGRCARPAGSASSWYLHPLHGRRGRRTPRRRATRSRRRAHRHGAGSSARPSGKAETTPGASHSAGPRGSPARCSSAPTRGPRTSARRARRSGTAGRRSTACSRGRPASKLASSIEDAGGRIEMRHSPSTCSKRYSSGMGVAAVGLLVLPVLARGSPRAPPARGSRVVDARAARDRRARRS